MRLVIETPVAQPPETVMAGFNQDLFIKLNPPFPPVKVLRFDGSKRGDEVHLELNMLLFKQRWISVITEDGANDNEFYFVDEGKRLPFFLSYWRHRHRIVRAGEGSTIVDDITFRAPLHLSALLWPSLRAQFAYRCPVYQQVFGKR